MSSPGSQATLLDRGAVHAAPDVGDSRVPLADGRRDSIPAVEAAPLPAPGADELSQDDAAVLADELRIYQSMTIRRNLPIIILGNVCTAATILFLDFGATVRSGAIYAILFVMALLIPMAISHLRLRDLPRPRRISERRIRRIMAHSALLGSAWAVVIFLMCSEVSQVKAVVMLMVAFYISFGAVALSPTMPQASIPYVLPLTVVTAIAGLSYDILDPTLLLLIGASSGFSLIVTARRNWQETQLHARAALQRLRLDERYHRQAIEAAEREASQQRQAARTLRHLIEGLPFPLVIFQEGRVVEANPSAFAQFALSKEELEQASLASFFADPNAARQVLSQLRDTGRVSEYEVEMRDATGKPFWALLTSDKVRYQDVDSHVFAIYVIDARKRAEAALRESERRTYAMLESSPVAAQIQRHDGSHRYANSRTAEISGMTVEEFLQTRGIDHFVDPEQARHIGEKLLREGRVREYEVQLKRKDGTPYWALLSYQRVSDASDTDYFGWVYDITERKRVEAALREAREAADAANQAKSDFLSNMSHEIRTPMAAIIGLTELCLRTELNEKQRDYVGKAHDSATLLLGILNDILDFSKIEAGKLQLERTSFSLEQVLENVITVASVGAHGKDVELLTSRSADIPDMLIGDPLRLGQVLTNLVSNAVKFTDEGEVVLSVDLRDEDESGALMTFQVADTGRGMSAQQQEELFAAFAQADTSVSRRYGGTGLGLPISRNLVRLMGGELGVASAPGRGSTFSFTIRLEFAPEARDSRIRLPASLHDRRLLVVDDNAAACEVMCRQVEGLGLSATPVGSAREALERLATDSGFDAVLLDASLIDMNAFELARRVRMRGGAAPRTILASTIGGQDLSEQPGIGHVTAHLTKPATLSRLVRAIEDAFADQAVPRAVTPTSGIAAVEGLDDIRGARILLIEDNEMNLQVARELLQFEGFHVDVAMDGEQGLAALAPGRYDCVLMDMQMPVMDGAETTRRIRADAAYRKLPIIAMTANVMISDKRQAKRLGMNDHIGKPIIPADLFGTLVKWIEPGLRPAVPRARPDSVEVSVPDLPGIDTAAGLLHLNGDGARYLALLARFADGHGGTIAALRDNIGDGVDANTRRIAHTLRGLAETIGAKALARHVGQIEALLEQGRTPPDAMLDDAARELDRVLASIARVERPTPEDACKAACPTRKDLGRLARQLEEQLEAFDPDAADTFAILRSAARMHGLGDVFASLAEPIAAYDLAAALPLLREAMAHAGLEGAAS